MTPSSPPPPLSLGTNNSQNRMMISENKTSKNTVDCHNDPVCSLKSNSCSVTTTTMESQSSKRTRALLDEQDTCDTSPTNATTSPTETCTSNSTTNTPEALSVGHVVSNKRLRHENSDTKFQQQPTKTSVTTTTTTADAANASSSSDVFDGAYVYGLQPGDRVMVKWQIVVENEGQEDEQTIDHWWGATLLEYDGRIHSEEDEVVDEEEEDDNDNEDNVKDSEHCTENMNQNDLNPPSSSTTVKMTTMGVVNTNDEQKNEDEAPPRPIAVHVLEYDAYPEGGFPEKSREDVIFINAFELVDMKSQDILPYKREGDDGMITFSNNSTGTDHVVDVLPNSNSVDIVSDPTIANDITATHFVGGFEEMVNTILVNAMKKSFTNFESLPASIQLQIAEKITIKKEKLIHLMEDFFHKTGKRIGTTRDMKELIQQTMQD